MRLKNSILISFLFVLLFSGCEDNIKQNEEPEMFPQSGESIEKIQEIYLNVPSPMETTIILKNSHVDFDPSILYSLTNSTKELNQLQAAIMLGIYSTDLNYCILSQKKVETVDLLNAVIDLAEQLHLDAIVNENIRKRIEKNISNKDSMQVIIGKTFWDIETTLKENDRDELSSLIVTGGWIECLFLASELAYSNPENILLEQIIADQKYTITNINELLSYFAFNESIKESIVQPLINLRYIYDNIEKEEQVENDMQNEELLEDLIIGKYIKLKFTPEIIYSIHNAVSIIRKDLNN